MKRGDILDEAKQCVTVDRAATHGDAEKTFGRIAAVWSARLGIKITEPQVCILLADLKTCRAWGNPGHADNWIDLAGYAACGGEIATSQASPDKPEAATASSCQCGAVYGAFHSPDCPRAGFMA